MYLELKRSACRLLVALGADRYARSVNRKKLLVVMYHGVTREKYEPSVWTQLPLEIFTAHLDYLSSDHVPVNMTQVVAAIQGSETLPERAVLITFDDGLKNNFSVAYPELRRRGIPATVFLTVDFVGSDRFFWFDRLYLCLAAMRHCNLAGRLQDPVAESLHSSGDVWGAYSRVVEKLKRSDPEVRERLLLGLDEKAEIREENYREDFGLVDWSDVTEMHESGLIDFGVHTSTHQILSEMPDRLWEAEVDRPKRILESKLGVRVDAFCYPNGRSDIDYFPSHRRRIQDSGYLCAFSTDRALFYPGRDHPFSIGRIPAGHDLSSDPHYFRLSASGAISALSKGKPIV